jgi:hypothetical protein
VYQLTPEIRRTTGVDTQTYGVSVLAARRFPPGDQPLDESSRLFLNGVLPRFGLSTGRLADARGRDYQSMLTELLEEHTDADPVDVTVVAHAVPDFSLSTLAGIGAAGATAGERTMFGVSDSGRVTSFMALRLAVRFASRQGIDTVAVLVADQACLPYDAGSDPLRRVDGDAAALLLLSRRSGPQNLRLARRSTRELTAEQAVELVHLELVGDGPVPSVTVLGAGCPDWAPADGSPVSRAPQGLPAVGVWETAAALRRSSTSPVVVIDVEPALGEVAGAWL